MTGPSGAAPQTSPVRCVIWHAADTALPGELLTSLSKRVGRMTVCTDPHAALAEACLIERETRETPGAGVLLLVNPRSLPMAAEVVEAATLYAPGIARWRYERGANPKLRAIVEGDVESWESSPVKEAALPEAAEVAETPATMRPQFVARTHRPVTTVMAGSSVIAGPHISPRLRLSGVEHTSAQPVGAAPGGGERKRAVQPLLTEEELNMLLSDEPLPLPPNAGPGTGLSSGANGKAPHPPGAGR